MPKYKIEITETLQRVVEVEADTAAEALSKVEDDYATEKIVLDYDDCKDFQIREYKGD